MLAVVLVFFVGLSCEKTPDFVPSDSFNEAGLIIPSVIEVNTSTKECVFDVDGVAPETSDKLMFTNGDGMSYSCSFKSVGDKKATVTIVNGIIESEYTISLKRESRKKNLGKTKVKFITEIDFEPDSKSTVYGQVLCDGKGVAGVVVSDGYEVVTTNGQGIYQMRSGKEHGYVFISTPSGYEVPTDGIRPLFYCTLSKGTTELERADFELKKVDQSKFKLLVFGDKHLANRTNDKNQYKRFTNDVNSFIASHPGEKFYGLTLGDMTWDLYWYSNKFCFPDYLEQANNMKGITVYHTIGNHDHDMKAAGDFDTVTRYKKEIGPTYYSFNLGEYHIVVLDNIDCTNSGAGTSESRTYNVKLVSEELNWLAEDLKYVASDAPLIITQHAPMYKENGKFRTGNASILPDMLKGHEVHYYTGHTHIIYNVDKMAESNTFEHNAGAVCGTWWWSANETAGVHVSTDGTPGGYMVVDIDGRNQKWQFKATDAPVDFQFRTYDGNCIDLDSKKWCPSASGDYLSKYNTYSNKWTPNSSNYVYLNVWNYDPEWKIEVKENGKSLDVTKVTTKDPLHIVSYVAQRANKNAGITFGTTDTSHMYRVQASSATSTLEIKVTDRFGNVYTETMQRPKKFTTSTYKLY